VTYCISSHDIALKQNHTKLKPIVDELLDEWLNPHYESDVAENGDEDDEP
jgi:hypothetical protein